VTRRLGIVLFDNVEELDAVGPWEVLAYWALNYRDDDVEISSLSPQGGEVTAAKGLRMVAQYSFADAPTYDVLVHPGGQGTRPQMRDDQHLEWVQKQRASVPLMTSVCTGSLVYAAAGLLRNRPAPTHWAALDLLAETDPTIDVRREARYVDDGEIVTSAGVAAGIDMALHLVRRLAGEQRARDVRRGIQYDPEPPV
jgi:transcriptional regulator GlxA family with amidase domain